MTAQYFPIAALLVIVPLLVRAEFKKNIGRIKVLKPLSTILCIMAALLALTHPQAFTPYFAGILIGLLLSLLGDIALIFPENPVAFAWGLRSFLAAHAVYAISIWLKNGFYKQDLVTGSALAVVAALIYARFWPNLGRMRAAVLVYMLTISCMVLCAVSALFGESFSQRQAWLICLGAILFYASDLMLAWNRYAKPFRFNRISLFFYYAGQSLFALSVSAV